MLPHTIFHGGPYTDIADVENATGGWVDRYNTSGPNGSLGYVPPVEYEQAHYAALSPEPQPVWEWQRTWGASVSI